MREAYTPIVIGVNGTSRLNGRQIGGFLAKTSGTITIVDQRGTTIVDAVAVTGGVYTPMPFHLSGSDESAATGQATVTLAGGASGTLGY